MREFRGAIGQGPAGLASGDGGAIKRHMMRNASRATINWPDDTWTNRRSGALAALESSRNWPRSQATQPEAPTASEKIARWRCNGRAYVPVS